MWIGLFNRFEGNLDDPSKINNNARNKKERRAM